MEVKLCIASNAYADMNTKTNPPKFEGSAAFIFNEMIDILERYGK